jgi:hypothetical protein
MPGDTRSERVGLDSLIESVAFFHELIRNADVAQNVPASPHDHDHDHDDC